MATQTVPTVQHVYLVVQHVHVTIQGVYMSWRNMYTADSTGSIIYSKNTVPYCTQDYTQPTRKPLHKQIQLSDREI